MTGSAAYLTIDERTIDGVIPRDLGRLVGNFVYICEDSAGEVVYVGKTGHWRERRTAHRGHSEWWREVSVVHLLRLPGQEEMDATELVLIKMLTPRCNNFGTPGYVDRVKAKAEETRDRRLHALTDCPQWVGRGSRLDRLTTDPGDLAARKSGCPYCNSKLFDRARFAGAPRSEYARADRLAYLLRIDERGDHSHD